MKYKYSIKTMKKKLHDIGVAAKKHEDGRGPEHVAWMLENMTEMDPEKEARWLGFAFGVLVERKVMTLGDVRLCVTTDLQKEEE